MPFDNPNVARCSELRILEENVHVRLSVAHQLAINVYSFNRPDFMQETKRDRPDHIFPRRKHLFLDICNRVEITQKYSVAYFSRCRREDLTWA